MVQIAGKYVLVENKNFYEIMLKFGATEEQAKKANEGKSSIEIEVDGNKFQFTYDSDFNKRVNELILNQEVDEKLGNGTELKSTTTQNGSVLTINSKRADGTPSGHRTITFSDTGLEVKIFHPSDDILPATRTYKRI